VCRPWGGAGRSARAGLRAAPGTARCGTSVPHRPPGTNGRRLVLALAAQLPRAGRDRDRIVLLVYEQGIRPIGDGHELLPTPATLKRGRYLRLQAMSMAGRLALRQHMRLREHRLTQTALRERVHRHEKNIALPNKPTPGICRSTHLSTSCS